MKLLDITYKLTDKAIMPDKMGVISKKLYDWTKYNYYENSIPEIEYIMHLCKGYRMEMRKHHMGFIENMYIFLLSKQRKKRKSHIFLG